MLDDPAITRARKVHVGLCKDQLFAIVNGRQCTGKKKGTVLNHPSNWKKEGLSV